MADIPITVLAGNSARLLTAGKYCDKNILVSAQNQTISVIIDCTYLSYVVQLLHRKYTPFGSAYYVTETIYPGSRYEYTGYVNDCMVITIDNYGNHVSPPSGWNLVKSYYDSNNLESTFILTHLYGEGPFTFYL